MSGRERVEADLKEAQVAVSAARTLLSQGSVVDLAGLERRIEDMCNLIDALPASDRQELKSLLVGLIDDLNTLAGSLSDQYETLAGQLQGVSDRHRAVSAYGDAAGKTDGPAPKPKK